MHLLRLSQPLYIYNKLGKSNLLSKSYFKTTINLQPHTLSKKQVDPNYEIKLSGMPKVCLIFHMCDMHIIILSHPNFKMDEIHAFVWIVPTRALSMSWWTLIRELTSFGCISSSLPLYFSKKYCYIRINVTYRILKSMCCNAEIP